MGRIVVSLIHLAAWAPPKLKITVSVVLRDDTVARLLGKSSRIKGTDVGEKTTAGGLFANLADDPIIAKWGFEITMAAAFMFTLLLSLGLLRRLRKRKDDEDDGDGYEGISGQSYAQSWQGTEQWTDNTRNTDAQNAYTEWTEIERPGTWSESEDQNWGY